MTVRHLSLFMFPALCFLTASAQDGIETYKDRNAFSAAARDLVVHDFEGLVPNSGFKHYQREGALRYAGSEFRPGGGGRFGPGPVIVVGGWYQAGAVYETTTGAKLHWSPPNQTGSAYLEITLPSGATAAGIDVWAVQPAQATIEVTATTSDGKSQTETVVTPARPGAGFIGFASGSAIASLRLTPSKGQTGLIIDNFSIGKSVALRPIVNTGRVQPSSRLSSSPVSAAVVQPAGNEKKAQAGTQMTGLADGPSRSGLIAYVRGSTEIRLVNPDGTGDRHFWDHPDLTPELGIFELAWKPDGRELAFSSAHEATSSPYIADIYVIRSDGSNLHRLTNPPDRGGLGRYPKGSVTVNVSNFQPASVTPGDFIVYIVGADEPQKVFIPAGTSKAVTFKAVADFGRQPQMIVAMHGKYRWFVPGPDVVPGRNVTAPMFPITGQGFEMHGAFRPVWRSDGSRVSYRSGLCLVSSVSATPVPGASGFNPFFAGKNPMGTCTWDWGPTAATADQVIYTENSAGSNIFQMTEGASHPGRKLTQFSDLDYQLLTDLHWIPDGSGLLYSTVNLYRDSSNIFRYDFGTKRTTQITRLEKEFARAFSISPDSRSVVFERCTTREEDAGCDLWTIGVDGEAPTLLVKNGQRPAWGR